MSVPSGAPALDLTVSGLCHHLPISALVSECVGIHTTTQGTEAHADLTIGHTLASGAVTLGGDEADAEFFEQLSLHAGRAAAWLRRNGRAA
jgi:hypothetical protein